MRWCVRDPDGTLEKEALSTAAAPTSSLELGLGLGLGPTSSSKTTSRRLSMKISMCSGATASRTTRVIASTMRTRSRKKSSVRVSATRSMIAARAYSATRPSTLSEQAASLWLPDLE